jgi:DNA replication and repair protein RecF
VRIDHLRIRDFRNIESVEIGFRTNRTVVLGSNGQGKTNLLEAVHLVCVTRAFRTSRLKQLIRAHQPGFALQAQFATHLRGVRTGRAKCEDGALIFELDGQVARRVSEYFGRFPLVLLSPESLALTQGPPEQRRRLLDRLLCWTSSVYLDDLLRYQQALRQRTALLAQEGTRARGLEIWEEELQLRGQAITARRLGFMAEFEPLFAAWHGKRFGEPGEARLRYKPSLDPEAAPETLAATWREQREGDRQRGWATLGPQRDDLDIELEGRSLRAFGSQGQHKLVALCLALAEAELLHARTGEQPLLALDDLFGLLDDTRIAAIAGQVDADMQLLITTTSPRHLDVLGGQPLQVLRCEQGRYEETGA